jgi:hypothetical protein
MPEDLGVFGEDTLLRHRSPFGAAECEGITILASDTGNVVALDDHARIIWTLLDGWATLGELADDVADVFAVPRETALEDLRSFTLPLLYRGFLATTDEPNPPAATSHLPPPTLSCNCSIPDVDWCSHSAVRVGSRTVGIRSNLPEIDAALRAMLSTHLVDDPEAPPNLSLVFRGAAPGVPAPSLELYHGHQVAWRSPSSAVVRESLLQHLGAFTTIGGEHLVLAATAVGGPDGVVLVGSHLGPSLRFLAPALHRRGLTTGPSVTAVDPAASAVVVDHGTMVVAPTGAAAFDRLCDWTDPQPGPLPVGRYPIRAIALAEEGAEASGDRSSPEDGPARQLSLLRQGLATLMAPAAVGPQAALDRLLLLDDRIEVRQPDPSNLADWVLDRLDAPAGRPR